jgi:DnaJ-class molecular chaperone
MKIDYSPMYLHALKEIKLAYEALTDNEFQAAYEHCLNAQTEMRLMSGAVKTWIEIEDTE